MRVVSMELNEKGFIKEFNLGNTAEIVPRLNGGNITQYKCDYHWVNDAVGLRTLLLGGTAINNNNAGLSYFDSSNQMSYSSTIGFRSSCLIK